MSDVDLAIVRAQVEILQYVKTQQARLKEIEAGARAMIEEALGGNEIGKLDNRTVVTWKHIKSYKLNQSYLKHKFPAIHAECCEISESRRFEVS